MISCVAARTHATGVKCFAYMLGLNQDITNTPFKELPRLSAKRRIDRVCSGARERL